MFADTLFPDFVPENWVTEQPTEAASVANATGSLVAAGIN